MLTVEKSTARTSRTSTDTAKQRHATIPCLLARVTHVSCRVGVFSFYLFCYCRRESEAEVVFYVNLLWSLFFCDKIFLTLAFRDLSGSCDVFALDTVSLYF